MRRGGRGRGREKGGNGGKGEWGGRGEKEKKERKREEENLVLLLDTSPGWELSSPLVHTWLVDNSRLNERKIKRNSFVFGHGGRSLLRNQKPKKKRKKKSQKRQKKPAVFWENLKTFDNIFTKNRPIRGFLHVSRNDAITLSSFPLNVCVGVF